MADDRSGRVINSSERGELGFWKTVISGVIVALMVAAVIGVIAWFTNERIERPTAERFLREYYKDAVRTADRDRAWNMLSVSFQENEDKLPEGRKTYDAFFSQWRDVQVSHVETVSGDPDSFEADVTYISSTGHAIEKTRFKLVFSFWIKKNPFRNCKPEDIKINDTSTFRE